MATTAYNFAEGDIKLRYREPYLSDSLNTKYQYIVTSGVYDGFLPSVTGAAALHLLLRPASTGSVAVASSNILGASAYQVSVHIPAPTVLDLDLSSYVNKTVAVVLEASFQRPSVTSASIKVYDLATETVPSAAVVFCEVTVPASGSIPAANVNLNGRSLPWDLRGRDAIPLIDIVKNGTFHFFTNGQTTDLPAPYWNLTAGNGSLAVVNALGPEGVNDNLLVATAVAGANTVKVSQPNTVPVTPSSMRVRVQAYYQQVGTLTTGNAAVKVYFRNANNPATVTDTVTLPLVLPTGGTTGTWYYLERFITVEATSSYAKYLSSVEIDLNASEWAAIGTAFRLTNVSAEVEQSGKATDLLLENSGDTRHTSLAIVDRTLTGPNAGYAKVFYTDSTNILSISDETGGAVRVVLTGRLDAGSVYAPFIDYAGAISLGTTDATAISIGKTGVTATVGGDLVVSGSATFTGALVVSSIDSTGALNIGTTTQTGLTLGRGAVNTSISGEVINATASANAYFDGVTALWLGLFSPEVYLGLGAGSGVVYLRSRLDTASGGTLPLGTQGADTVNLGRVTLSGLNTTTNIYGDSIYLYGKAIRIGADSPSTSVTIGRGGVTTTVAGLLTASAGIQTATLNALSTVLNIGATTETINIVATSAINIGTITSQPVTIGNTLSTNAFNGLALGIAAVNTVTIGGGSGTAIGTGSTDGLVTIGKAGSPSNVAGYLRTNYIDATAVGNSLNLGTQAYGLGAVVISKAGQTTTIAGLLAVTGTTAFNAGVTFNTGANFASGTFTFGAGTTLNADGTTNLYAQNIDRVNSGATLSIGTTNAGTITVGRTGQTLQVDSTANFAGALNAASVSGVISGTLYSGASGTLANKVSSTVFAHSQATSSVAVTSSASTIPLETNDSGRYRTILINNSTDRLTYIPAGIYHASYSVAGFVTSVSATVPTTLTFELASSSGSVDLPSYNTNSYINGGGIAVNEAITISCTAIVTVSTTSAANDLYVTVKTNAGTLGLDLTQFNLVLFRIAPYA